MDQFSEDALARAVRTLGRRDPVLRPIIRRCRAPGFRPHSGHFDTLVDSIVSQQISSAAARSVLLRLRTALGDPFEPRVLDEAPDEVIRGCGISPQKLGYLRSLARHVLDGELELDRLPAMTSDEIIAELTAVKGIGVWTAQMFLIFSLGRLDILPIGDLGVRKGAQIAYGLPELPTPRQVEELAAERNWAPYRSVASWYMWRTIEP